MITNKIVLYIPVKMIFGVKNPDIYLLNILLLENLKYLCSNILANLKETRNYIVFDFPPKDWYCINI